MRHPRVVEPGLPHHVILRGNNRRRLFSYARDFKRFLELLAEATARNPIELHDFCLMRNHVHLIATPEHRLALATWVKAFAQKYAFHRNVARDGTGKLFEQRFKSFVITDERYLMNCSVYVALNPVRAGVVRSLADYPWSGQRLAIAHPRGCHFPRALWTPLAFYQSFGATDAARAEAYAAWFDAYQHRCDDLPEPHVRAIEAAEALSLPYGRRLERPNGSRCA